MGLGDEDTGVKVERFRLRRRTEEIPGNSTETRVGLVGSIRGEEFKELVKPFQKKRCISL